jgi:hypothetical protein
MFTGEATLDVAPELTRPDVPAILDGIRTKEPVQQFADLTPRGRGITYSQASFPLEFTASEFDAVIDFAADPTSSPSLMVRAQALELAVWSLTSSTAKPNVDPELLKRRDEVEELIPDAFSSMAYRALEYSSYGHAQWLRNFARILIKQEGIPEDYVFPDWHSYSFDPLNEHDANPVRAFMLLDSLDKCTTAGKPIPVNRMNRLIPLAFDIHDKIQGSDISFETSERSDLERRASLCRLIDFGDDHRAEIEAFLDSRNPEVSRYVDQLNELYIAASNLQTIFPESVAAAVSSGARELVASSIFALHKHFQNGKSTHSKLPLNDQPDALNLQLEGDEPLHILRHLTESMWMLRDIQRSAAYGVTAVTESNHYRLYRMFDGVTGKQASLYIRPQGGYAFDPAIEYGRMSEGVEASISYVVDATLRPGELLEVGKHRGKTPDARISIRLDREGVEPHLRGQHDAKRDPAQQNGTLSLDVGSVLGNDNWLSTKVGRFLAWGNTLRAAQRGERAGLNHVTHYFTESQGQADVFAATAREMAWQFEANRRSVAELRLVAANLALESM